MSKIAVVYWSGTGNTKAMADLIVEAAKKAGAEAAVFPSAEFSADKIEHFDAIAFGCPSMGVEELEETEFAPMFENCKAKLKGKKIALFGSYGWGDGEWMRTWEEDCRSLGASIACESVICCGAPQGQAAENCKAMGEALA